MKTTTSILSAALLWVIAAAAPAGAEETRKYDQVDTVTVVGVDATASWFTVDSDDGLLTYSVEPVTRVLRGGEEVGLDSVEVGDRVVIEARDEPHDGMPALVADRVVVVVDPPESD